ncbi:MAG: hypothetical protein NWF00_06710 [Candidatus Bathyarchaeota archaeon]|nr:hypothetical protein [Candidatus Bathyarchaeota archaeon]
MTEQETAKEPTLNQQKKKRRTKLFAYLDHIIRLSDEKLSSKGNSDKAKQGWARVMTTAIATYGTLLKDTELETIEERLTKIEAERTLEKWK